MDNDVKFHNDLVQFLSLWVINEDDEDIMLAEAIRQYRKYHGYFYRKNLHDLAAEALVAEGKAADLNEAKDILRTNVWILISFCFLISITPGAHGTLGHI